MADPRVVIAMNEAVRWFTPPAATAAERAALGADAVRQCDRLLRTALKAGIASGPNDRFGRLLISLEQEIKDEADALSAWAALGLGDEDQPAATIAAE